MRERFLELLERDGLNVAQVAKATNIPKTTLYSMVKDEKETRGMSSSNLLTLAKFFGVTMEYLMGE